MSRPTLADVLVVTMAIAGLVWFALPSTTAPFLGLATATLGTLYFSLFRRAVIAYITNSLQRFVARVSQRVAFMRLFELKPQAATARLGPAFTAGLLVVFALSAFLLSYRLGTRDFQNDEHQVVAAAAGYLHTGDYYTWDFIKHDVQCHEDTEDCFYGRAWPHTFLIAQAYKVFGISEWSSRIVSVIFGVLLVIISYFFTRYFTEDRRVALMAAFLFSMYPSYLAMGRNTRMYALLVPLFLVLTYLFYRGLVGKSNLRVIPWQNIRRFVERNIHFEFTYLFLATLLLWLVFEIHVNVLVLLPSLLLFVSFMAVLSKERRYVVAAAMGTLGAAAALIVGVTTPLLRSVVPFLSFFQKQNLVYVEYLARYPLPWKPGVAVLVLGMASLTFMPNSKLRAKLVYLCSIVIFSFVFFAFVANRYASFLYISHVVAIAVVLITYFYVYTASRLRSRLIRSTLILLLMLSAIQFLVSSRDTLYGNGRASNLSVAYQTIIERYDVEHDVILSPMLRQYYLQGMKRAPETILLPKNKKMSLTDFLMEVTRHDSGWIAWEASKRWHLRDDVRWYVHTYFEQVHGSGLDDTKVEVYRFDQDMVAEAADEPSGTIVP